jgi:hypothetical protein
VAVKPTDISKVIATEDDFGHEMRVGRVLRGYLGSQTLQGGTYTDPVSGKARQFDFRWRYLLDDFALRLAVECKNVNPDSPVIISGYRRVGSEAFHELVESRKGGRFRANRGDVFLDVSAARAIRRVTGNHSIYSPEGFVGKSLLQLKNESGRYVRARDAEIYDKWSQALASGVDLVRDAGHSAAILNYHHIFTLILPVVVLPADTLWQIEYDITEGLLGKRSGSRKSNFTLGVLSGRVESRATPVIRTSSHTSILSQSPALACFFLE